MAPVDSNFAGEGRSLQSRREVLIDYQRFAGRICTVMLIICTHEEANNH
jgi:hypothetical protein